MDGQPGQEDGEGAGEDRDPEPPSASGTPVPNPHPSGPDPRLAGFAWDDSRDAPTPSGRMALLVDDLSGPERRCPGATDDELIGMLRAWAALESWAAGAKLGVIREVMRREAPPSPGSDHGDLPETWSPSLRYELAGALACSTQSAETTASLAWEQGARLPGIGSRLDDGTLTAAKARAVVETFQNLTDADAAEAEAMVMDQLADKTYMQVMRLAEQAALTVDPGLAERRREQAQKRDARVSFFREQAGTAGLSGRDLPPDEALAAMESVNARAEEYIESGAFGDTPMDVLRACAFLDLINGVPADGRIAAAEQPDDGPGPDAPDAGRPDPVSPNPPGPRESGSGQADPRDCPCAECDGSCLTDDDLDPSCDDDDEPDDGSDPGDGNHPDDNGDGGPGSGGPGPRPGLAPTGKPRERRPADLIVPLTTLLGLAERPGDIHGFGLLDPALARELAAAAAASPGTEVCVTVTSAEGYAIGHGCARPGRGSHPPGPAASLIAMPARLNLTIPAAALPSLSGPPGYKSLARHDVPKSHPSPWSFIPRGSPAAPDGFGTWTLVLPGGREFTVRLDPVPTLECDHRYQSHSYKPSDRLRHLVQIRDGTCTFPPCNRHARESDFEHALPYDQGGKTCACNAGARSRACHRVKQSRGWDVTQPRPGWHRWQTPAGRVYTQEPKRYPA
jgi:Domain of unknown function (DUF222)